MIDSCCSRKRWETCCEAGELEGQVGQCGFAKAGGASRFQGGIDGIVPARPKALTFHASPFHFSNKS